MPPVSQSGIQPAASDTHNPTEQNRTDRHGHGWAASLGVDEPCLLTYSTYIGPVLPPPPRPMPASTEQLRAQSTLASLFGHVPTLHACLLLACPCAPPPTLQPVVIVAILDGPCDCSSLLPNLGDRILLLCYVAHYAEASTAPSFPSTCSAVITLPANKKVRHRGPPTLFLPPEAATATPLTRTYMAVRASPAGAGAPEHDRHAICLPGIRRTTLYSAVVTLSSSMGYHPLASLFSDLLDV